MASKVDRVTVDLSGYPDLVVIYLGMKVRNLRGLRTMFGFGSQISRAVAAKPDGLLLHEPIRIKAGNLGSFPSSSGVVEEILARLRRHRLLA